MRVRMLREHYYSPDNGVSWLPKQGFSTRSEVKAKSFQVMYKCSHCNMFHKGRKRDSR